jgi:hypothetical protein
MRLVLGVPGKFEHNPAVLGSQACPALRSGIQVIISRSWIRILHFLCQSSEIFKSLF